MRGPTQAMQEGAVLEQKTAKTRQDQDALVALPSDHYSRYALTQAIIEALRAPLGKPLRILDVGGHSSPLAHFLPDDSISLLDVEPEGSLTDLPLICDAYIRASGANLPFRDAAFDIVAAHDTLEHVPPPLRQPFIDELLRVASRLVILSGPVWHDEVVAAEARIDRFVRDILDWRQPFLGEHIDLGLPRREDIEARFTENPFISVPSGDLTRWILSMAIRHYLAALPDSEDLRRQIDFSYNSLVATGDPALGTSYRRAYVIAVDEALGAALPSIEAALASDRTPLANPLAALEALLAGLEQHAAAVRRELALLHEAAFTAEKRAFELQGTHDHLAKSLGDREAQVREQQELIALRDEELLQTRTRLRRLERSLAGRIATSGPYRALESLASRLVGKRRDQR